MLMQNGVVVPEFLVLLRETILSVLLGAENLTVSAAASVEGQSLGHLCPFTLLTILLIQVVYGDSMNLLLKWII